MTRELICIICPRGCPMTACVSDCGVTVTGNSCPRGEEYAAAECLNPVRTVTSIVRVSNRTDTMVSVRTDAPIPKGDMFRLMELLRQTAVEAPVQIGDVILQEVFGTRVVATKQID